MWAELKEASGKNAVPVMTTERRRDCRSRAARGCMDRPPRWLDVLLHLL